MKQASIKEADYLMNHIPICIAYVDTDLTIQFANNTYDKWFKMNPNQLIGKPLSDYFYKDNYAKITPFIQEVLTTQKKVQFNLLSPRFGRSNIRLLPDLNVSNVIVGIYLLMDRASETEAPQNFIQVLTEEKDKIKSELEDQNRELESQAILISSQQKALVEIKHSLKLLDGEVDDSKSKKIIKKIMSDIQSVEHTNNQWKRIKLHFEKIHPSFFETLSDLHPQLNQNDLKHCAFIKLKLSNKDLALILNISPKSVQMARYRIKKKMNLPQEKNLIRYIERMQA
ncbi:MAG: PAS domain-containing protein [Saprospiraceae bacterium]